MLSRDEYGLFGNRFILRAENLAASRHCRTGECESLVRSGLILVASENGILLPDQTLMRALRSLSRFLRELFGFAREHKAWWIVPVVLVLLIVALVVVSVSTISPFIYSLF